MGRAPRRPVRAAELAALVLRVERLRCLRLLRGYRDAVYERGVRVVLLGRLRGRRIGRGRRWRRWRWRCVAGRRAGVSDRSNPPHALDSSKGRSERLPTGPLSLAPRVLLQSHAGSCHSKTTTVPALYNDKVTKGKRLSLSFRDPVNCCRVSLQLSQGRCPCGYLRRIFSRGAAAGCALCAPPQHSPTVKRSPGFRPSRERRPHCA